MLLNRSSKVPGIAMISKGGISGTVTDIKIILQYAIKSNASAIIALLWLITTHQGINNLVKMIEVLQDKYK